MSIKFEEAKYINGSDTKMYPVETITYMREYDPDKFQLIKPYLYCPECNIPTLRHCNHPEKNRTLLLIAKNHMQRIALTNVNQQQNLY